MDHKFAESAKKYALKHKYDRAVYYSHKYDSEVYVIERDSDEGLYIGYPAFIIVNSKGIKKASPDETLQILGLANDGKIIDDEIS